MEAKDIDALLKVRLLIYDIEKALEDFDDTVPGSFEMFLWLKRFTKSIEAIYKKEDREMLSKRIKDFKAPSHEKDHK